MFSFLVISGHAAHLVGGEITYKCLGNNNYEVTLTIYRDCFSSGAPFDALASITIYDTNDILVKDEDVPLLTSSRLPVEAPNNCTTLPLTVCTEKGIYRFTTNLPPKPGGYLITHQRCCRNATIINIPNPDDWGSTYSVSVPGNDSTCNSTPAFNATPPVVLCLDQSLNLDMSATDPDNDSLYYELCTPVHGGGKNQTGTGFNSPKPDIAAPPPYTTVPYSPGFSASTPITSSNPVISIDPSTGILSGRPTQVGQYVFTICVSEYRSGTLISTVRRDFQFNVSNACKATISQMETQIMNPNTLCNGPQLNFTNLSRHATTYLWDFGDPFSNGDTSRLKDPTYTYADTGTYTVTLIANPGDACADTSFFTFKVHYPISITSSFTGDECFNEHSFDFELTGNYSAASKIEWNFGGATNLGFVSDQESPKGVKYQQAGVYPIKVIVEDFGCTAELYDTIYIFENPKLDHTVPESDICVSETVYFQDNSTAGNSVLAHHWDFGDGTTSGLANPVHVYEEAGVYTVMHTIRTFQGCKDSLSEVFPDHIRVFSKPKAVLDISPSYVTIYEPQVTFTNLSEDFSKTKTFLPNGEIIETFGELTLDFKDTGTFRITHVAFNDFGCADSTEQTLIVDVPLNIYVPNAFTPNADGINDEFRFEITGAAEFSILIFNRWGEVVYESTNPNEGWNGQVRKGSEAAPQGLYTYQMVIGTIFNARDIKKYGTLTLLR